MMGQASVERGGRVLSVDALRGFVMFTMLFVNDVGGTKNLPWWMKHYYPYDANGMTFVDLVFPAFLFIVGMSIPIALSRRRAKGERMWRSVLHLLVRSASLILLGVFTVNAPGDAGRMGWPAGLWGLLVYVCAIAAFVDPPKRPATARWSVRALRVVAFAALAYLAWVYRDKNGAGMHTSWWGILGLIGWAYLVASLVYLALRRWEWALLLSIPVLMGVYYIDKRGIFDRFALRQWISIGSVLGSQAAIVMSGVVLGKWIEDSMSRSRRFLLAGLFTAVLAAGAIWTYPHFGINKNAATPSWCLWAAAIATALWMIFSVVVDVLRIERPVGLFIRGGGNVLLAYLLMPVWIYCVITFGWTWYGKIAAAGVGYGVGRSLVMAGVVLWVAGWARERGMRLRL